MHYHTFQTKIGEGYNAVSKMTRCIHSKADKQGFSSKLSIFSSELELYSESESSEWCFLKQFKIMTLSSKQNYVKYFLMTTVTQQTF